MPRIAKTNTKTTAKSKTTKTVAKSTPAKTETKTMEIPTVEQNVITKPVLSTEEADPNTDFTVKTKTIAVNASLNPKIKHDPEELVPCRSITRGEINYLSKKSGMLYIWADYGDVVEVQYQDLFPLVITKSPFIFNPYFVVEDTTLVDEWWDKLGDIYTKIYNYDDIDAILRLSPNEFRNSLLNMPQGIKDAVKTSIATKIDEGTFDSLQKIKIVDEVMGTDLKCLVS